MTAEFTLVQPARSIVDYDTGVVSAPDTSTTFSGVFQPYQAHVFQISSSAPVRTPVASATPSPAASATPSGTPTTARTPTATATATVSATPTATATAGALSVSPAKLKFNAQKVRTTSRARILKVTNEGAAAVSFTGMPITGDFAQTNTCGASVAGRGSCTISVTFKPTAAGKRTGNLPLARQRQQQSTNGQPERQGESALTPFELTAASATVILVGGERMFFPLPDVRATLLIVSICV